MSRATGILERVREDMPLNFLFFLYEKKIEPLNKEVEKENLRKIGRKAQNIINEVKQGLRRESKGFKTNLDVMIKQYPILQDSVKKDIQMIEGKSKSVALKVKRKFSEIKGIPRDISESSQNMMQDMLEGVSFQTTAALKTLEIPQDLKSQIWGAFVGMVGFGALFVVQSTLLVALGTIFQPTVAFTILACLVAPIFEEFFKVLSVKITKTEMPAFVFALAEFSLYMLRQLNLVGLGASPLTLLGVFIARYFALGMHTTTSALYLQDQKKYGKIRMKTIMKGIGIHFVWNFIISVFSVLSTIGGFLGNVLGYTANMATVSINKIFRKAIHAEIKRTETYITQQQDDAKQIVMKAAYA